MKEKMLCLSPEFESCYHYGKVCSVAVSRQHEHQTVPDLLCKCDIEDSILHSLANLTGGCKVSPKPQHQNASLINSIISLESKPYKLKLKA